MCLPSRRRPAVAAGLSPLPSVPESSGTVGSVISGDERAPKDRRFQVNRYFPMVKYHSLCYYPILLTQVPSY